LRAVEVDQHLVDRVIAVLIGVGATFVAIHLNAADQPDVGVRDADRRMLDVSDLPVIVSKVGVPCGWSTSVWVVTWPPQPIAVGDDSRAPF
jgi:hypothetical protein